MKPNNYKVSAEGNRIVLMYQLDSQSRKTLESLSADKIKKSISQDAKFFQHYKIPVKG